MSAVSTACMLPLTRRFTVAIPASLVPAIIPPLTRSPQYAMLAPPEPGGINEETCYRGTCCRARIAGDRRRKRALPADCAGPIHAATEGIRGSAEKEPTQRQSA